VIPPSPAVRHAPSPRNTPLTRDVIPPSPRTPLRAPELELPFISYLLHYVKGRLRYYIECSLEKFAPRFLFGVIFAKKNQ